MPIVLPDMESVTEATVVEWRKAVGEAVAQDEIVVEVSTDKVDLEVPAPAAGAAGPDRRPGRGHLPGLPAARRDRRRAPRPGRRAGAAPDGRAGPGGRDRRDGRWPTGGHASPLARRIAGGTGRPRGPPRQRAGRTGAPPRRRGRRAAGPAPAPAPAPSPAPAAEEGERAVALKGPPAALAGYMDESLGIPTATSFRTVNVGVLDERRRALNGALAAAGRKEKLSYTHLVAWAIIRAVQRWPVMGTGFARIDGVPHRLERSAVNLGLAVDAERKDGTRTLMVPVIRERRARSASAASSRPTATWSPGRGPGQVKPDELRGATITLTNPGGLGTVASVPRLMAGQGTIVATGSIALPPGFERAPGSGCPSSAWTRS